MMAFEMHRLFFSHGAVYCFSRSHIPETAATQDDFFSSDTPQGREGRFFEK